MMEPHRDEGKAPHLGYKEQSYRNKTGKASLTDVLMERKWGWQVGGLSDLKFSWI